MKKYIIIILAAISTLSLSFSAEAYTREELEEQMRSEMSAAYSTYNSNKEKLAEVQNTLNGLDGQKAAALKELGIDSEPDFMDSSIAETDKVNERYEPCLIYALTRYIWSFAKQEAELTARESLTGQRFKYRYALPEDLLFLRGQYSDAKQSSSILDFEKRGNYILTDSEEVFITYTRRVAESELPIYFTDFLYFQVLFQDPKPGCIRYRQ